MRTLIVLALITCAIAMIAEAPAAEKDSRIFEMRVYYAAPGKLEALNARFKNHTLKLFEKHGLTNIGYFVPVDNKDNKLVYFIASPSNQAHAQSFKEFIADPEWTKAYKESEKDGKLVDKIESTFMSVTDYSPALKVSNVGDRVFELRTYTPTPGHLENLNDRFKDHTIKLFEKYGMTNIVYWNTVPGQKSEDKTGKLVYLLAHKSPEAAKQSFAAFAKDPEWVAAKAASEKKAGGSLTEPKGGVVSEFLVPTDYSPLK